MTKSAGIAPPVKTDWFAKRRDRFIRQIVDDFFGFVLTYQDIYGIFLSCRSSEACMCADLRNGTSSTARNQLWDRLSAMVGNETEKGLLWQLKDTCHLVWPERDEAQDLTGPLLDWLIGSIFHEIMKLKENIYLLNAYAPAALRISKRPGHDRGPARQRPAMHSIIDIQNLTHRLATDVTAQMEQINHLIGQASYILRTMMAEFAPNLLVLRLLVEREQQIATLWGESLEDLLEDMYPGGPAAGLCAAGRSYLDSQWYEAALVMYERALLCDQGNSTALVKRAQLRAVLEQDTNTDNIAQTTQ